MKNVNVQVKLYSFTQTNHHASKLTSKLNCFIVPVDYDKLIIVILISIQIFANIINYSNSLLGTQSYCISEEVYPSKFGGLFNTRRLFLRFQCTNFKFLFYSFVTFLVQGDLLMFSYVSSLRYDKTHHHSFQSFRLHKYSQFFKYFPRNRF